MKHIKVILLAIVLVLGFVGGSIFINKHYAKAESKVDAGVKPEAVKDQIELPEEQTKKVNDAIAQSEQIMDAAKKQAASIINTTILQVFSETQRDYRKFKIEVNGKDANGQQLWRIVPQEEKK